MGEGSWGNDVKRVERERGLSESQTEVRDATQVEGLQDTGFRGRPGVCVGSCGEMSALHQEGRWKILNFEACRREGFFCTRRAAAQEPVGGAGQWLRAWVLEAWVPVLALPLSCRGKCWEGCAG